jgi:hypothetical protein
LEEELFAHRRDLLTTLDVVFMDTTSLYFEGEGGQTLGRRGFSKDHRPDLNQMILAALLDQVFRYAEDFRLPNDLAARIHDAHTRSLQRNVDSGIVVHGHPS